MSEPEIHKLLVLSTSHLPEHLGRPGEDGLGNVAGVVADGIEFGWLMWVPPEDPRSHVMAYEADPMDDRDDQLTVVRILEKASELGCAYVKFDSDGPWLDGLPTWEW